MNWTYDQGDPAMMLFTAAVARFGLDFAPGARVLELGCAETDFLERLHRMDPTLDLYGVDARWDRDATGWTYTQGSAMDPSLFPFNTFDAIVMLGALEHFGLGFYGDPIDEYGDIRTMVNIARWLKPGGQVYFDVPCNPVPEGVRVTENRHFRYYDPGTVADRLFSQTRQNHLGRGPWGYEKGVPLALYDEGLQEIARGYSLPEPHAGTWIEEPTAWRTPYHFVAVLAQKVA